MAGRLFVIISSNQLIRVEKVDDSFAYITVLTDPPKSWAMPRAEYDTLFIERYRLPMPEDLITQSDVPLPVNAPPDWYQPNVLTDRVVTR